MPSSLMVTTIIPCHNHRLWVRNAIRSVITQDHRPLRLVVVDDGSTDGSVEAVASAFCPQQGPSLPDGTRQFHGGAEGVPIVLVALPKVNGPSFARNVGLQVGFEGTDIFALLDSDDEYIAGKISRSLKVFEEDPNVGAVYTDYETVRPDGLRTREFKPPFSRRLMLVGECVVNCDSLVSKRAVELAGEFDVSLRCCEDYDFWMRVSEKVVIHHIPESFLRIRVGSHSSTSTLSKELWNACFARVFEKTRERLGA